MKENNKIDIFFILVVLIIAIFSAWGDITALLIGISFTGIPLFNILIKNKNVRRIIGGIYVVFQILVIFYFSSK
ncbi:hypothetical protein [uncultured Proteiniphilum sp.]|uniref:hypothetical protein n=1 Tax=uncultured Proteiniphilum sp. TaxID=497637 RepID=UPI00260A7B56|nr:hypothetical protein [uncultured Proteiniphilum sp.]